MQYGAYFVYIFFMLLLAFWGRKIGSGELPLLTKLLIISGLFVFFALGGNRWQELWGFLWPHWALAIGFGLGLLPRWFGRLSIPGASKRQARKYQQRASEDLQRQKEAAEADLRRQEREAVERLRKDRMAAEEELRRQAEQMRKEAEAGARSTENNAHQQERPTPAKPSAPDPYEILGLLPDASPAEIKSAYRRLANKYHPDKAMSTTDEIQKLAEEKFKAIKQAYDALKDHNWS